MQYKKAVEYVGLCKLRVKALGLILWVAILVIGIFGSIKLGWYILPLTVLVGWILGNLYAIYMGKKIERLTGLGINAQVIAYHESLAGQGHPLSKNYNAYRKYVESIPDEEV